MVQSNTAVRRRNLHTMRSLASKLKAATALLCGAVSQVSCDEGNNIFSILFGDTKEATPAAPPKSPEALAAEKELAKRNILPKAYTDTLFAAVRQDDIELMELLLTAGCSLQVRDSAGNTLLHEAAAYGQISAAHFLLSNGIEAEVQNTAGHTALQFAEKLGHKAFIQSTAGYILELQDILPTHYAESLATCCINADWETVRLLLQAGADTNATTEAGDSPLHRCAAAGAVEGLRFLIRNGGDIHKPNAARLFPIDLARSASHADSVRILAAEMLLSEGINKDLYANTLRTATQEGDTERMALLAEAGANLRMRSKKSGDTLLHTAVAHHQAEAVQFLLNNGVPVNKANHDGYTPLMLAAKMHQSALIAILGQAGADANALLPNGDSILQDAINNNHAALIPYLAAIGAHLNKQDAQGNTLLHHCAMKGQASCLAALIEAGAQLKQRNLKNESALHLAFDHKQQECVQILQQHGAVDDLFAACMVNDAELAEQFVNKGESPNLKNASGITPLHIAAAQGHTTLARLLVQHGAEPMITDHNGHNAFEKAREADYADCASEMARSLLHKRQCSVEASELFRSIEANDIVTLQLLLEAGISPDAISQEGWPALHVATNLNKPDCLSVLLTYGADAQQAPASSYTALHLAVATEKNDCVRAILAAGVNPNARTADGCTALHLAARTGNHEALADLIQAGAPLNHRNLRGDTPLNELARWPWGNADSAQALIDAGADVSMCNILNESPLHSAAISGNSACIALLIRAGIDTEMKSLSGKTPLELARYHGQNSCAELLKNHSARNNSLTSADKP